MTALGKPGCLSRIPFWARHRREVKRYRRSRGVHGFVERGRQEGAEVVAGGEFGDGKGAFSTPTVLAKISKDEGRACLDKPEAFQSVRPLTHSFSTSR
jgi:acyl-CoA reductase-like NAD-dependent aldehyde dehydrogenase